MFPCRGERQSMRTNSTLWIFIFSHILSEGDSRHVSISTISVGSRSLSADSTLFAATPVARRAFVLTIRILANGKCFFMLRSGKFNNTLAGFMLSSENRMNMERDCDLKSSKSASPEVWGPSAFNSKPSPVSTPFSRVTGLFLYLFLECFVLQSLVYPKKQN